MGKPSCVHPFMSSWTFTLFSFLIINECSTYCLSTGFCVDIYFHFSWIDTQKSKLWVKVVTLPLACWKVAVLTTIPPMPCVAFWKLFQTVFPNGCILREGSKYCVSWSTFVTVCAVFAAFFVSLKLFLKIAKQNIKKNMGRGEPRKI